MDRFYAVIKLITGEEIFSLIESIYDETDPSILLIEPCVMKDVVSKRSGLSVYKVEPWLRMSDESIHIIEMKHVICLSKCDDESLIKTYQRYLKTIEDGGSRKASHLNAEKVGITTNMGYIHSVEKARKSLESIYKLDIDHSP